MEALAPKRFRPLLRFGLFLAGCEARDHLSCGWWFIGHPWYVPWQKQCSVRVAVK